MADFVNATGWEYIKEGNLLEGFKQTLLGTFLGHWIFVLLILTIDFVIYLKTRNYLLTASVNLLLLFIFMSEFPMSVFIWLLVPSALALAGAIWTVFR